MSSFSTYFNFLGLKAQGSWFFATTVDAAVEQPDSLVRMAYVAGFAMSNYSSTVGRLAKWVSKNISYSI